MKLDKKGLKKLREAFGREDYVDHNPRYTCSNCKKRRYSKCYCMKKNENL